MIKLDISKSDRYNLSKIPSKFTAVKRDSIKDCVPYKFHFSAGEDLNDGLGKLVKGFYVFDQLSPVVDKPVFLKLCMFVTTSDWSIAKRKDGEFLYFYDCDNVVDRSQPFNDFFMSGFALMSYEVFGDNINKEVVFQAKDGKENKVPFFVFTTPVPLGYYICHSNAVIVGALIVNLPGEKVASALSDDFILMDRESWVSSLKSIVAEEFFGNEFKMGLR